MTAVGATPVLLGKTPSRKWRDISLGFAAGVMLLLLIGLGASDTTSLGWYLVAGIAVALRQASRRRSWTRTEGTIVGFNHSGESSLPRVRFVADDGEVVEGEQNGAFDIGVYLPGGTVPVWYDPANPERFTARVRGSHASWTILVVIGVVMTLVGVLLSP